MTGGLVVGGSVAPVPVRSVDVVAPVVSTAGVVGWFFDLEYSRYPIAATATKAIPTAIFPPAGKRLNCSMASWAKFAIFVTPNW